ncbi:MAG: hypothetical protein ABI405_03885 [Parafilimonas sp.]
MKKKILLIVFLYGIINLAAAQSSTQPDIPLVRVYFHEKIDSTQRRIEKYDGKPDGMFKPADNDALNTRINDALTSQVDALQTSIEESKLTDNNDKIRYLRGLNECLERFLIGYSYQTIKAVVLPEVISGFTNCMALDEKKESIFPEIQKHSYDAGDILVNCYSFNDNEGMDASKDFLLLKDCSDHPERMLVVLSQHPDLSYADSLIVVAAHTQPDNLYTYAAASNKLAERINNNPDSLVQLIVRVSKMSQGRMYFPFLDNLNSHKISFEDVDAALRNDDKYYSLLVKTEIDYADRLRRHDTALSMPALQRKLADKAKEIYVNVINGLHESPDNVRFKKIENLTPEELYYLAVMTEDEIYTSSYTHGVYPFIWKQMKTSKGGDSLLMRVRFDHFRKWIKMAANYNTLNDFLKRMDKGNAEVLMKAFVNGLERSTTLEDAVDVADSYASITDKAIHQLILNQVQYNLKQARETGNKKAADIYNILNTLFLSLDTSNHVDVAATLGIPPVYFMPNKAMQNDNGQIIIQQFFYGDKDGKGVFNYFLNSFNNSNWKITYADKWAVVSSTKGVPVKIYSNKPLDEEKDLDADAQSALDDYLSANNLDPTMVIHRGHSYYLPSTLEQLDNSAKLVLLGSCGAYQHLNKVLSICPTAQIISSRQTGSGTINGPMINIILEQLRQGKDLDWPTLWKTIGRSVSHQEYFDDYVPPFKNLGAVFIMAYKKELMNQED